VGRIGRTIVAGFDAVVMGAAAYVQTGGRFALTPADLVLWGSAAAAALCAVVVFANGSPYVAWSAIGYIVFGGLLTDGSPHWPLLALAAALTPLVPRPRGSVIMGIGMALLVAIAARVIIGALL
jgi:hypothetical protein